MEYYQFCTLYTTALNKCRTQSILVPGRFRIQMNPEFWQTWSVEYKAFRRQQPTCSTLWNSTNEIHKVLCLPLTSTLFTIFLELLYPCGIEQPPQCSMRPRLWTFPSRFLYLGTLPSLHRLFTCHSDVVLKPLQTSSPVSPRSSYDARQELILVVIFPQRISILFPCRSSTDCELSKCLPCSLSHPLRLVRS